MEWKKWIYSSLGLFLAFSCTTVTSVLRNNQWGDNFNLKSSVLNLPCTVISWLYLLYILYIKIFIWIFSSQVKSFCLWLYVYEAFIKHKFAYVRKNICIRYFYIIVAHIHHYDRCNFGNGVTVFFIPPVYQSVSI